jgi:hypothetical protein
MFELDRGRLLMLKALNPGATNRAFIGDRDIAIADEAWGTATFSAHNLSAHGAPAYGAESDEAIS